MQNNWYAKDIFEALTVSESSFNGLSAVAAERRLSIYGLNEVKVWKRMNIVRRFLYQFHNLLIYVLLVAGMIAMYLGHFVDASVILAAVTLNAILGLIQEGKAGKALEAIRQMLTSHANVIRDGEHITIPTKYLVVGDIVLIRSGDKVPADLRLFDVKSLQIQEAILTGESNVSDKNIAPLADDTPLGDRTNMAYSGTTVTFGKGRGVVVATGKNTEIGKIGTLIKNIKPLTTPLIKQMSAFARWLTLGILVLAGSTFAIGVLVWHEAPSQMFMAAVSLAVAAVPEGLPPILSIILAIGVTKMAKRKAIIRHLPAVETMGAVTTICTDKTGTLTRNEQTVQAIVTADNVTEEALKAGILCNDAEFSKDLQGWHIYGDPLDKALLEFGLQAGLDLQLLHQKFPRSDLIPYESEHKFMATLHHTHESTAGFIYIKGAPEQILSRCAYERSQGNINVINLDYWQEKVNDLASKGYRVIAIAYKNTSTKRTLLFADVAQDLILLAVFALIDAPRAEVAAAVAECYQAGIKVKMITGDHAMTAATIATAVGISDQAGVLTGTDIDRMTDSELRQVVPDVNIYARTSPQHKLRLVRALQENGEVVAMTGDGVNDAPALCKANVGISMGYKGSEIAKEAAAMVLADDNFTTIVHAVEEGRVVYDNLKRVILFMLPTNIAEAGTIVMAILLGATLPITPVQILWVNLITVVTLAIALGFEPAEEDVMYRAPRKPQAPILSKFLLWRSLFVTVLLVLCVFSMFIWQLFAGADLAVARTVAVNMLVWGETIYLFNCRKFVKQSWHAKTLFGSKPVLLAVAVTVLFQVLFTYLPVMQQFFGTAALSFPQWVYITMLAIGVFIIIELEKLWLRHR